MAKTLLDAVNEILRRGGMIQGDNAVLTSLANSPRQRSIDIAVQVVNEGIDELYLTADAPQPLAQSEATFTLTIGTRGYVLASDLVRLRINTGGILAIDKTNTQFIYNMPGGYNELLVLDPEQDDTGLPLFGAIGPNDGKLYVERAPTSVENGRIYTYQYDRDLALVDAPDPMPFSDFVFRAMVPVWHELWKREQNREFDGDLFKVNLGRASRALTQITATDNYCPR